MRALIPQRGGVGLAGFLPGAAFSGVKDRSLVLMALAVIPEVALPAGASASSIIGIFVTPVVSLVLWSHVGSSSAWRTVGEIVLQLFVPFVCGQLLQPLIGGWIERNESAVGGVDQGSILLIVYSAFSEAVSEGLWRQVPPLAAGPAARRRRRPSRRRADHHRARQQMAGLRSCRPGDHRLLRLEEEPVSGHRHG
jgi:SBF-like CPA transporter family (DUF4137)